MIFTNPWGLLALLSIPLIVGLHFFRDRRRVRRIGGLHLWQFARTRLPVGRRFDRLIRNLPLLFQLLAALLLSLLIGGLDRPRVDRRRHATLIVDSSVSMTAGADASAAAGARRLVAGWARPEDKFTLIAAGLRPRIIAGPFASRDELLAALNTWAPDAPGCDLEAALGLATKFLTGAEKILFLTDDAMAARADAERLEVAALGQPRENAAIHFADRLRAAPGRDRIVITLRAFASEPRMVHLQASAGGKPFYTQPVRLDPEKIVSHAFETTELERPIELTIDHDSLAADNRATLAPVNPKTVRVGLVALGEATRHFAQAARAVPDTLLTDAAAEADLVFSAARDYAAAPCNWRVCQLPYLPDLASSATQARLAEGRMLVVDQRHPAVGGLALEGVLWPYVPLVQPTTRRALIAAQGQPLLTVEELDARHARYRLNLLWDRTNLFRQAAWPTLVQGLIEECREAMPGLARANFRAGEAVALRLDPDPVLAARFELYRSGLLFARYDAPPELIPDLPAGGYELMQDGKRVLARFQVNLFAQGESDLRAVVPRQADLAALATASINQTQSDKPLFLGLVMLTILFTALSWIFQDMSR